MLKHFVKLHELKSMHAKRVCKLSDTN